MAYEQPALFDPDAIAAQPKAPLTTESAPLTASSSVTAALAPFEQHMIQRGFTQHTINAFLGDLKLFVRRWGKRTSLGALTTHDLNDLLRWLDQERGVPCSPKSYARRVTTLKVFFAWLKEAQVLPADLSETVVQVPAASPLPLILYESQIEDVLAITRGLMSAEKPDARPHLLVTLVLHTGIKKGECMAIEFSHLDLSDPKAPVLFVRYEDPRNRLKERRLRLPEEWPAALAAYRAQYTLKERLFPCTPRNLEYVLRDVAQLANLPTGLSFEMLRWTCAVRDFAAGMDEDHLRRKLGLSPISWRDTLEKVRKLAEPPL